MTMFLDTGNVADIRSAYAAGLVKGVTTNPALAAREGKNHETLLREILAVTGSDPVFAEVVSPDADGMVAEGKALAALDESRMVIKIPANWPGLQAAAGLKQQGYQTLVTVVYTPAQALLAAATGADYVAPYLGKAFEVGQDGMENIRQIAAVYKAQGTKTKIVAAGIRNAADAVKAALAGADILTVPFATLQQMANHPQTEVTLREFLEDFEKIRNL